MSRGGAAAWREAISEVKDEDIAELINAIEFGDEALDTIKRRSSADQIIDADESVSFHLPFNRIKNQTGEGASRHKQMSLTRPPRNEQIQSQNESLASDGERRATVDWRQPPASKRRWMNDDSRSHNRSDAGSSSPHVHREEQSESGTKRHAASDFRTGNDELQSRYEKKHGASATNGRKTLGGRRTVHSSFVSPLAPPEPQPPAADEPLDVDDRLKHIEPKMVELIRSEIMDTFSPVCTYHFAFN